MGISGVLLSPLLSHFVVSHNPDPLDSIAKVLREVTQIGLASAVAHYPHWEIVSFVPGQISGIFLKQESLLFNRGLAKECVVRISYLFRPFDHRESMLLLVASCEYDHF